MAQRLAAGPEGLSAWGTADDALLRHRDDVHAVVRRVLADAGLAEDVVQETLARALRHEATVDRERAGAWLTVVGRRLAIDVSKGRQRFDMVAEHRDRPASGGDPADLAEQRELLARLAEAMDELSPRQRRLLLRQVDTGLSLAQLAEEEQTTVASVRSVLARAREALRANLHDSGWLVAGLLPRLLTSARGPAERLLARLDRLPFVPQGRHDLADVFTAGAAVVALVLSAYAGGGDAETTASDATAQAPFTADGEAASADIGSLASSPSSTSPLDVAFPSLSLEEDLSVPGWWVMPPEREHIEIPFQDFGGDVTHFAVSPDQHTIFAVGGWVEATESEQREDPVKRWTPLFYRSDDAGQTWTRQEVPGFVPGRILFSPTWPADRRVFVVTDDKSVLQSDDGGQTFALIQQVGNSQPPVDEDDPGRTLAWVEERAPDPRQDPVTTIREQQHAPRTDPIRPAVLSRSFAGGTEEIYIGGAGAGVFDVSTGVFRQFVGVPPWQETNGVAPAPENGHTGAVLVGAVAQHTNSSSMRGAVYRCESLQCQEVRTFDDMGNAPGLYASRNDPDLLYAWTPYTAYRSADGGRTWTRQVLGPVLDLVEVGRRMVFVSMSGVPVSDDWGVTWRELPMVYSMWAAAAVGDRHLVVASGPGMACSPDAGDHWLGSCPPL
jgi:RNA polymerase sigma-70 factor (ECF subfamily)